MDASSGSTLGTSSPKASTDGSVGNASEPHPCTLLKVEILLSDGVGLALTKFVPSGNHRAESWIVNPSSLIRGALTQVGGPPTWTCDPTPPTRHT